MPFNPQKSPKAVIPRNKIKLSRNIPGNKLFGADQASQTDYSNLVTDPIDILRTLPVAPGTKRGVPNSAGKQK